MTRRSSGDEVEAARVKRPSAPMDELPLFGGEPATPEPVHVVPVRAHVRRISGDAPPSGAQLRDAALAEHEADDAKRVAIEYVRNELRHLYVERVRNATLFPEERVVAGVTADDVASIIHRWSACPRVIHEIPQHWRGAIFAPSQWERTGQDVESSRPHMRSTRLPVWRLRATSERRAS